MDEIVSWFLAILVILAFFIPKILGFLFFVGTVGAAFWAIADVQKFMSFKGEVKRGIKVSSKPLSGKLRHYLESLSEDIVEYRETAFGKEISAFIRKQNREVLVCAKQWHGLGYRRSWPFVGYVNLSSSNPMLEFRSSLPFHLFLLSLALTIILLPFLIGMWAFSFSIETQAIEKFLQSKIEAATS